MKVGLDWAALQTATSHCGALGSGWAGQNEWRTTAHLKPQPCFSHLHDTPPHLASGRMHCLTLIFPSHSLSIGLFVIVSHLDSLLDTGGTSLRTAPPLS